MAIPLSQSSKCSKDSNAVNLPEDLPQLQLFLLRHVLGQAPNHREFAKVYNSFLCYDDYACGVEVWTIMINDLLKFSNPFVWNFNSEIFRIICYSYLNACVC